MRACGECLFGLTILIPYLFAGQARRWSGKEIMYLQLLERMNRSVGAGKFHPHSCCGRELATVMSEIHSITQHIYGNCQHIQNYGLYVKSRRSRISSWQLRSLHRAHIPCPKPSGLGSCHPIFIYAATLS